MLHKSNGVEFYDAPEVRFIGCTRFDWHNIANAVPLDYLEDNWSSYPEDLVKFAGQVCYQSFGEKRTRNHDLRKYIENILKQGHGSVLEHANYSFLIWGVSRSLTHELVRHRAGCAYSQLSQRYCDKVQFVLREEYKEEVKEFVERCKRNLLEYEAVILKKQAEFTHVSSVTERLKAIRQIARSVLPNETATMLVMTANGRALRHILEMRGSLHAETEIRRLALIMYEIVKHDAIFQDFQVKTGDTLYLESRYKKV